MAEGVSPLVIEFLDERVELGAAESLTFGRTADIVLDEANPFLHRVAGSVACRGGVWWLDNVGSRLAMTVIREDGTRVELLPGASTALPGGTSRVLLQAGRARYELVAIGDEPDPSVAPPRDAEGETTSEWGTIPLNFEQRQLLVAICEPRFVEGTEAVPANKDMARRLGWSLKKLERKLDYLCRRFAEAGVPGVHGPTGGNAVDRRRRLAEHVTRLRLVTSDDLPLLGVNRAG